jgi:GTP-binding protein HflX
VLISAASGEGLDGLKARVEQVISTGHELHSYRLAASDGALINWLYEHGQVRDRHDYQDGTIGLEVRLAASVAQRFEHMQAEGNGTAE